jgi:hypothetical protein
MSHDRTAAPSSDSTNAPAPKPLQFSLRTLLAALAVCPVLLAVMVRFPATSIGALVYVVLGLTAVGCLKYASRVGAGGGESWRELAAGFMVFAGVLIVTLLILSTVLVAHGALLEVLRLALALTLPR